MFLRATAASLVLAGASLLGSGAFALEPAAVDAKFKDVTVLTPVSKTGELMPLKQFGMLAFFSPLAADLFAGEWRKRPGNKGEFRVAPLSLTQFEAAFLAAGGALGFFHQAHVLVFEVRQFLLHSLISRYAT